MTDSAQAPPAMAEQSDAVHANTVVSNFTEAKHAPGAKPRMEELIQRFKKNPHANPGETLMRAMGARHYHVSVFLAHPESSA